MINLLTIGVVCGNLTKSLIYMLQGLGFNDCLVALHHLGLCRFPLPHLVRPSHNVNQSDNPIAIGSIPPLALGHGEETGGLSKTDEGFARSCRILVGGE